MLDPASAVADDGLQRSGAKRLPTDLGCAALARVEQVPRTEPADPAVTPFRWLPADARAVGQRTSPMARWDAGRA